MNQEPLDARVLDRLYDVIRERRTADPDQSHTARLFAKGLAKIGQKVGEEAVETVIEGVAGTPDRLAAESADLLYHLLVLWSARELEPGTVWAALEARRGRSGVAEKTARQDES